MTTHLRLAGALRLLETLQVLIRARLANFFDFSSACTGPCAILVLQQEPHVLVHRPDGCVDISLGCLTDSSKPLQIERYAV